jgi:hypothetical protein
VIHRSALKTLSIFFDLISPLYIIRLRAAMSLSGSASESESYPTIYSLRAISQVYSFDAFTGYNKTGDGMLRVNEAQGPEPTP